MSKSKSIGDTPTRRAGAARRRRGHLARAGLAGAAVALALIQLVPYGRDHTNPQTRDEPTWDVPVTRALAVRACFDCHSNETAWPPYTWVAPASWLAQRDVDRGRRQLNFSEWGPGGRGEGDAAEAVLSGQMPPPYYVALHRAASLSPSEKQTLAQGLARTLGRASPGTPEAPGERERE